MGLEDNVRLDKDTLAPSNAAPAARVGIVGTGSIAFAQKLTPAERSAAIGVRPSMGYHGVTIDVRPVTVGGIDARQSTATEAVPA